MVESCVARNLPMRCEASEALVYRIFPVVCLSYFLTPHRAQFCPCDSCVVLAAMQAWMPAIACVNTCMHRHASESSLGGPKQMLIGNTCKSVAVGPSCIYAVSMAVSCAGARGCLDSNWLKLRLCLPYCFPVAVPGCCDLLQHQLCRIWHGSV